MKGKTRDVFARFPKALLRRLTHKYMRLAFIVFLLITFTFFIVLFEGSRSTRTKKSEYNAVINRSMDFINRKMTEIYRIEDRTEQNEVFRDIETDLPITPLRMTLTTAVFLFHDSEYKFIMKRILSQSTSNNQEETLSMKLKHENIVDTFYTENMEYDDGYEVQNILWIFSEYLDHSVEVKSRFGVHKLRTLLIDILKAVIYMHKNNIIHLDLKTSNVMGQTVGDSIVYKLIDFGFSRDLTLEELDEDSMVHLPKKSFGTFPYKPPEVVLQSKHGKPSDIWCIGAIAWFMSRRHVGFRTKDGEKDSKYYRDFLKGKEPMVFPRGIDPTLEDFIRKAMHLDPKKRPTAVELYNHPFLKASHSV